MTKHREVRVCDVDRINPRHYQNGRHESSPWTGVQGYLFQLPDAAADLILGRAGTANPPASDPVAAAVNRLPLDQTTRKALIESRLGQGRFRQDLLSLWKSRCAVTGLALRELLRASHMKPWRSSNNAERLDPYNGLLLAPSYDAAFDVGLISFTDTEAIIFSSKLDASAAATLGIASTAALRAVQDQHKPYLAYHRDTVFQA